VEEGYPADLWSRRIRIWLERRTFQLASRIVVVTPSSRAFYEAKARRGDNFGVEVPNGFIGSLPDTSDVAMKTHMRSQSDRLIVLHSGTIYAEERNPMALFAAISRLKRHGVFTSDDLKFVFRGAGSTGE